ncbi:MAG: Gfo/Idh/MocA family oxidoreductase [Chloroflexi bacterium]|nr:Gfo/Idh/MocA family oxidoreductase [Chloroflexota bacterium]
MTNSQHPRPNTQHPVRVAVIGLGAMGRNHVKTYADLAGAELVAVADSNPVTVEGATRGRAVRGYTDFRELLANEKVAAVSVVVPTTLHAEVAGAALAAGVHVLVEKPIAGTIEDGEWLVERARAVDRILTVGHIERYNPAIVELKRRVQAGELGKVFQIQARRTGPFPDRIRDVGVVIDLATHDLDVMRYVLGSEIERVYAETARRIHTAHEDLVSGLIRFTSGAIGHFDVNWLTPTKIRELTVTGERGMFVANYLTQELSFYANNHLQTSWEALDTLTGVSEGDMTRYSIQRKEPLRAELEAFVAAVAAWDGERSGRRDGGMAGRGEGATGRPARSTTLPAGNDYTSSGLVAAEDGLEALRLAQLVIESGRRHQVIAAAVPKLATQPTH